MQTETIKVATYDTATGQVVHETFEIPIDPTVTEMTRPGYFPAGSEAPPTPTPFGVIGHNDIVPVVNPAVGPTRAVVAISDGQDRLLGTGFLVGPSTVVTAAHVVYDRDTHMYRTPVQVAPARTNNTKPFGSQTVSITQCKVSDYYLEGDWRDDWAVLYLSSPIGNTTGYLGLHWQNDFTNTPVICYGYPDKVYPEYLPNYNPGTDSHLLIDVDFIMYYSIGTIYNTDSPILYAGDWDNTAGFSGGPLVLLPPGSSNYCAMGINCRGNYEENHYGDYLYDPTDYTKGTYSLARPLSPGLYQYFSNTIV